MNWIKKYLENKREEREKRKQEEFLNTRIPLNELVGCTMFKCTDVEYFGETLLTMSKKKEAKFHSMKILRKIKEKDGYNYIDPITGTKYRKFSHYSVEINDIVVNDDTLTIKFSEEALKRQYVTIADLIEVNKRKNEN